MPPKRIKNPFGCAVPKNPKPFKKALFSSYAADAGIRYPKTLDYEFTIDAVHDQQYGTCFCEAATTWVEQWLWMKTGKKWTFTEHEIWEIAADSKLSSKFLREADRDDAVSGGYPKPALEAIYNFNQNLDLHYWVQGESEICNKFIELVDKDIGSFEVVSVPANRASISQAMFENGPMPVSVNWYKTPGSGHCIVACKYNEEKVWFRNSWGDKTLVGWTWHDYEKYSMANAYGDLGYDVYVKGAMKNV